VRVLDRCARLEGEDRGNGFGLVTGDIGERPHRAVGQFRAEPVGGTGRLPQSSALLVVKRGPNAGSRFLLDQPTTTAGRHPNSDIFLDDITVSRRHAQFRCVSGEFQIVDVGSLNRTYVNGEPVDWAVLANGDEMQIGKFRLVFLTGPTTGDTESVTS
jgi:pSer/pThr/pTyr-binding forkhead associated (FHA) protein